MNRLLLCIAIGTLLTLTHVTSFALTPLAGGAMKESMGQAGVNVWIKDVEVWQHVGEAVYTDHDGLAGAGDGASIVLSDKEFTTTFRAITADTDWNGSLTRNYKKLFPGLEYSPLKIDVAGKTTILTRGDKNGATSVIAARIPTLEITKTEEIQSIKIRAEDSFNHDESFITIKKGPSVMAQLGGKAEVYSH